MKSHPFIKTRFIRIINGIQFSATSANMERGRKPKLIFYLVRYDDGDVAHFFVDELKILLDSRV